jgi:hypothetical protein
VLHAKAQIAIKVPQLQACGLERCVPRFHHAAVSSLRRGKVVV